MFEYWDNKKAPRLSSSLARENVEHLEDDEKEKEHENDEQNHFVFTKPDDISLIFPPPNTDELTHISDSVNGSLISQESVEQRKIPVMTKFKSVLVFLSKRTFLFSARKYYFILFNNLLCSLTSFGIYFFITKKLFLKKHFWSWKIEFWEKKSSFFFLNQNLGIKKFFPFVHGKASWLSYF